MTKEKYKRASVLTEKELIKEELNLIGQKDLVNIINNDKNNEYFLVSKMLSFADIPTFGKFCYTSKEKIKKESFTKKSIKSRVMKNRLFYTTNEEMEKREWKNRTKKIFFCQTKQSNINLPNEVYEFLNIGRNREFNVKSLTEANGYSVKIVNDSITNFFDKEATNKLFEHYQRKQIAKDLSLTVGKYTKISLSIAVHGIGKQEDITFHNLRANMFAKDNLYILIVKKIKHNNNHYDIYLIPYRNTMFYKITKQGIPPHALEVFENDLNKKRESREGQSKWRRMLADLYLIKSGSDDNIIKCPFTGIEVSYPDEFTLMRASHIKDFKCCNKVSEAYSLDNGFLLTASADALFDKHLISINPHTLKIERSKKISKELIDNLKIRDKVDEEYISSELLEYLKFHYEKFEKNK